MFVAAGAGRLVLSIFLEAEPVMIYLSVRYSLSKVLLSLTCLSFFS